MGRKILITVTIAVLLVVGYICADAIISANPKERPVGPGSQPFLDITITDKAELMALIGDDILYPLSVLEDIKCIATFFRWDYVNATEMNETPVWKFLSFIDTDGALHLGVHKGEETYMHGKKEVPSETEYDNGAILYYKKLTVQDIEVYISYNNEPIFNAGKKVRERTANCEFNFKGHHYILPCCDFEDITEENLAESEPIRLIISLLEQYEARQA